MTDPKTKPRTEPSTRLYVILARKADRGVIFRRGPSKRVALIGWDTKADRWEKPPKLQRLLNPETAD